MPAISAASAAKPMYKAVQAPGNARSAIPQPFSTKPSTYPNKYTPTPTSRVKGSNIQQFRIIPLSRPGVRVLPAPITGRAGVNGATPAQSYGIYGLGGNVPNVKATPMPNPVRRSSTIGSSGQVPLHSYQRYAGRGPGLINGAVFPTPSARRTVPAVARPRAIIVINPRASPTPVPGGYTPRFPGEPGYKGSPTPAATLRAVPTVVHHYLMVTTGGSFGLTPSPKAPTHIPMYQGQKPKVTAQARSYVLFGGPTPRATVTAPPAPAGSVTPVPGGYTPRFPGEPGYKRSPTPIVKPTVTPKPKK
jgi:hypothetical protein